ncbi:MAG: AzlC family ABC transporter permease [Hydrogeniiclostridium sp.]
MPVLHMHTRKKARPVPPERLKGEPSHNSFSEGFRHGIPIGLGYFSVSIAFGIKAVSGGLTPFEAVLISLTNLTSAGQFAGITVIAAGASLLEMALTQLVVNLRYALMSLSLSQKLHESVGTLKRCVIAFGNTDEIFAVASSQKGSLGLQYMLGLMTAPIFGWSLGTLTGAVADTLLPDFIRSALGIALYGMFIAIVVPPMKKQGSVRAVVTVSLVISTVFYYIPGLSSLSPGFVIIICTLAAAGLAAFLFPLPEEEVPSEAPSAQEPAASEGRERP